MAHKYRRSLFGIGDTSLFGIADTSARRSALRSTAMVFLAMVFALQTSRSGQAQTSPSSYVPAVVASSVSPVPTTTFDAVTLTNFKTKTNLLKPSEVALDSCGNIYAMDHGYDGDARMSEIPAGGGGATIANVVGNSYGVHMGQDASHASLIVAQPYSTGASLIPLNNCVAQSSQAKKVGGGPGALFYYYNPGYVSGDFLGNTYIATNGTCCVTGNYYLIQEVGGVGNILLSNQPLQILSPAVDKLQNVYFITGAAVYELPFSGVKYAATPIPYGKFINPVGLSVDSLGNLYVADSSAGAIYEIPNEGSAGLNLADQFVVSSGLNINVAVAVNARGDMYYTAAGASSVSELTLGNANFNAVVTGQSATRILNFQFNALSTVTNIQAPGGDFTIQPASPGTAACTTPTPYGPSATTVSCQITVGFKPATTGAQSSAVVLTYFTAGPLDKSGKGTTVTRTVSAFIEGIGQAALLTLDPGTVTPAGSGLRSPAGVVVDHVGNTFVADPGNNAIMEYPAGGGAAVSVATTGVTPPLSAPTGVAVDGAGDVFIADTGNNRVLEVPFVNGALSPAAATIIASGLKAPASVFVQTNGDLYVADTGNNTILVYPSFNGPSNAGASFGAPTKLGSGLLAPLAVTVDGPGNIYIADSGNNQIVEYPLGAGQAIVAANILNPSALATDSSGSLFVVDQGNFRVLRIPSVQGTLNPNGAAEVGLGIANPYGVAVDASSNLYVTDKANGAAYTIARSQIGLSFGNLAVGTASTALPLTVESAGNLPLVFNSPFFTETGNIGDFGMTSPTGACADGLTLQTGTNCDLATTFTPAVAGARSATIAFASNAANAPKVTVTGTGVSPSPTTTTLALITSVPGAPFYGEPLSVTATVAPTTGTATPTGVVSFVVDGTQIALLPVTKGVATLLLNSGLTGGGHTIYAVYKGDTSNNGSSSVVLPLTISRAPTTPIITITKIPFNNPYSLRHSNTGSCNVTDTNGFTNQFPAIPNDGIGFTASVSSPGIGVPSGTLTFYSDGQLLNGTPVKGSPAPPTSVTPVLPFAGGVFSGSMTSDANTLGDGTALGQNNVLIGPHNITVVYSGDQNYLPSTSVATLVTVTDVSSTTPVTLPQTPVSPAPYCDAGSTITGSRPSNPSSFTVASSSPTITASAGAPGTATLTISSLSGWAGSIDVACPDLPQYTTCSTNPGQVTINPSTPGQTLRPSQTVLTVTTNVPPYVPTATQGGFWLTSVLLGLLMIVSRRRFKKATGGLTIAGFALLLFSGIAGLSGCGSSTSPSVVTKPGTYPITVVLTGAQHDGYGFNEVFRADVPYKIAFTLNVK